MEARLRNKSSTADATMENEQTSLVTNESAAISNIKHLKHNHKHKTALPDFSEINLKRAQREKIRKKNSTHNRMQHSLPKKPLWRNTEKIQQVSRETLERFSIQL